MVMLPPKKFSNLLSARPGHDTKLPKSKSRAPSPKDLVTSEPEARRSGLDWATFSR